MTRVDFDNLPDPATARDELTAFNRCAEALTSLNAESRQRVFSSLATFLGMSPAASRPGAVSTSQTPDRIAFSEDRTPSPKDFLFEKSPKTDIDRVACIAYYLTHYRDTQYFKTLEISKLNTEAAQTKLSNASKAVDNAARAGLLVQGSKGQKQLSAVGELYVQALPDRVQARVVLSERGPKRRKPSRSRRGSDPDGATE